MNVVLLRRFLRRDAASSMTSSLTSSLTLPLSSPREVSLQLGVSLLAGEVGEGLLKPCWVLPPWVVVGGGGCCISLCRISVPPADNKLPTIQNKHLVKLRQIFVHPNNNSQLTLIDSIRSRWKQCNIVYSCQHLGSQNYRNIVEMIVL